ncbi:hypothetical protein ACN4EG_00460 [Alkalinema pantanalense CENA528]|uniref:hypothetical protein n=1 Tax=Alkalinema pantanalense TaxID=1620705 RepID=UPI003D6F86BA
MMKANLKRIEQTLHRLERPNEIAAGFASASTVRRQTPVERSVSFEVSPKSVSAPPIAVSPTLPAPSDSASAQMASAQTAVSTIAPPEKSATIAPLTELHLPTPHGVALMADRASIDQTPKPSGRTTVASQPSSPAPAMPDSGVSHSGKATDATPKALHLPKMKSVQFSSHRNGANPGLAASLLREMLGIAEGWHVELAQVVRQIQDLYIEGPIVDGWLESTGDVPHVETVAFKHAEISQLIQFVEKLQSGEIQPERVLVNGAGYRLCGLNADGRVWSCPCPAEQVPTVSLAIARHHRLRQLLARQQDLESRLGQLSEDLVMLHGRLKQ